MSHKKIPFQRNKSLKNCNAAALSGGRHVVQEIASPNKVDESVTCVVLGTENIERRLARGLSIQYPVLSIRFAKQPMSPAPTVEATLLAIEPESKRNIGEMSPVVSRVSHLFVV